MKNAVFLLFPLFVCAGVGCNSLGSKPAAASNTESVSGKDADDTNDGNTDTTTIINDRINFVAAAKTAMPAVVHIKSTYGNPNGSSIQQQQVYGRGNGGDVPAMASGSGVIIAADGYIATNNHVVENATKLEVILPDRRQFIAKLVGRDPGTDLALLKIDATNLPVLKLGNSDKVQVGEWVLAVGYPYSLNTTVTAGIISAKGRSIGIIHQSERGGSPLAQSAIESFLQTDAAINPGNSGGALVNTNGELIGINAAIASLTGSYAGYAFSIPVNLAKKVLNDIKQFGRVKRGVLGVAFPSPAAEEQFLKEQGIVPGSVTGVFITGIQKGSAADSAGLKEGDIIQTIDGVKLFSSSEFSERIARHNPGDKVTLGILRKTEKDTLTATLRDEPTERQLADNGPSKQEIYNRLGARFSRLTPSVTQRLGINSGVLVTEVLPGGFFDQLGIPPGTIIAYINGRQINDPEDIENALMAAKRTLVQILAIAPDGSKVAFNFSFGA
ncbi:trypsin-like peptidase domain-containing protein [Segetibacter koreensis]|uniref:trypsin-like peptidase domain-containing protein n=1 Tax=Segetibacter koreensis TaxID=398037 RepID=UPI00037A1D42|nr:trypsin-like peptidase domain-containing protein [Segetibacter koreensis]